MVNRVTPTPPPPPMAEEYLQLYAPVPPFARTPPPLPLEFHNVDGFDILIYESDDSDVEIIDEMIVSPAISDS